MHELVSPNLTDHEPLLTGQRGYTLGLLLPPDSIAVSLDDASNPADFLPDAEAFWIGYPLYQETVPYRPNLLMRERWKLAELTYELVHLLFGDQCFERDKSDLYDSAKALSAKAQQWYQMLPSALCFSSTVPTSLYELQYVT